jgi:putative hydrolase of the HAD superfamily
LIEALFLDVGGVLGTNGWGRDGRARAAAQFGLDEVEGNERHRMVFDAYETGKVSLSDYLQATVFYKPRNFSEAEFVQFMLDCSQPWPHMLDFIAELKQKHKLHVVLVSNEGRELAEHRVRAFKLKELADALLFSAFVQLRKPDPQFYKLALDIIQVPAERVLTVDDRPLFVETARRLGTQGLVPQPGDMAATRAAFASFGLS